LGGPAALPSQDSRTASRNSTRRRGNFFFFRLLELCFALGQLGLDRIAQTSQVPTARSYFDVLWYNRAMQSQLTEAARKLSIADWITLVEEIWDTIAEENQASS
jgi:hypothetical protein